MLPLLLLGCATQHAPPPPALPTPVAAPLPEGPGLALAQGRCTICHGLDMLAQQRLTPAQWEKTVKKMQGWGAPVTDEEAATLAAYLAASLPPDAPPPPDRLVVPPPEATRPGSTAP